MAEDAAPRPEGFTYRGSITLRTRSFHTAQSFPIHRSEAATISSLEDALRWARRFIHSRCRDTESRLGPGDTVVVQPGTPHVWSNGGDGELHMVLRFEPALNTEEFFESYFALAAAGKTDPKGNITNPLQVAVLLEEFSDFLVPTKPPRWALRAVAALAPIARRLGYGARPAARREPSAGSRPA